MKKTYRLVRNPFLKIPEGILTYKITDVDMDGNPFCITFYLRLKIGNRWKSYLKRIYPRHLMADDPTIVFFTFCDQKHRPISSLIGTTGQLEIAHRVEEGRTYAEISSILSVIGPEDK